MVLVYREILFFDTPQTFQTNARTVPNMLFFSLLLIFSINWFRSIVVLFIATHNDLHLHCRQLRSKNELSPGWCYLEQGIVNGERGNLLRWQNVQHHKESTSITSIKPQKNLSTKYETPTQLDVIPFAKFCLYCFGIYIQEEGWY